MDTRRAAGHAGAPEDVVADTEARLAALRADDVLRIPLLLLLARELLRVDAARSMACAVEAERLGDLHDDAPGRFAARDARAMALLFRSDFDDAQHLIEDLAQEASPARPDEVARCRVLRGILLQRRGDLPKALNAAFSALQALDGASGRTWVAGTVHNLIGNLLVLYGDVSGALEHYVEAVESFEPHSLQGVIVVSNNVGMAHHEVGQYDAAIEAFRRVLTALPTGGQAYFRAVALCNLGLALVEAGRSAEAFVPLDEARAICAAIGSQRGLGLAHHNLARAHHRVGDLAAAAEHYDRSLAVRAAAAEGQDHAETLLFAAELEHDLGHGDAAIALLERVLETTAAAPSTRLRSQAHHALYRVHRARGDLAAALDHHVAYHDASKDFVDDRTRQRQQALAIRFEVHRLAAQNERERVRRDRFERLSNTDELTGLPNRRAVDQTLAQELREARALERSVCVAVLDIDRFKDVNDAFSHAVGDAVLRAFGALLPARLRSGDTVGRYGGEEFVVVFPGAPLEAARGTCERLRSAIASYDWARLHPGLAVTASFGVATLAPGESVVEWVARADAALYRAKAAGRDRVVVDVLASAAG